MVGGTRGCGALRRHSRHKAPNPAVAAEPREFRSTPRNRIHLVRVWPGSPTRSAGPWRMTGSGIAEGYGLVGGGVGTRAGAAPLRRHSRIKAPTRESEPSVAFCDHPSGAKRDSSASGRGSALPSAHPPLPAAFRPGADAALPGRAPRTPLTRCYRRNAPAGVGWDPRYTDPSSFPTDRRSDPSARPSRRKWIRPPVLRRPPKRARARGRLSKLRAGVLTDLFEAPLRNRPLQSRY